MVELTQVTDFVKTRLRSSCDLLDDNCFDLSKASGTLLRHFNITSLSEISLENADGAVCAIGAAMDYLKEVQKSELENIKSIDYYGESSFMRLDVSTLRNLEITETMRNREKRGSLLWVLDKTKTSMGKRMLRKTQGFQGSIRLGNINFHRFVPADLFIGHRGLFSFYKYPFCPLIYG